MKRIICIIVFAAAASASVWSVDWKAHPASLPENSILTNAQAAFGIMNWDTGKIKNSFYGSADLSADYTLPVKIPLTVGLQVGMGGASIKDWKGGMFVMPILARVGWHPALFTSPKLNKLDLYAMLKAGTAIGLWTGKIKGSASTGFALGIDVGARYYVWKNLGVFAELGFEGDFMPENLGGDVGKVTPYGMKFGSIGVTWRFDNFVKAKKAPQHKAKAAEKGKAQKGKAAAKGTKGKNTAKGKTAAKSKAKKSKSKRSK
jgi:hypothetical protein